MYGDWLLLLWLLSSHTGTQQLGCFVLTTYLAGLTLSSPPSYTGVQHFKHTWLRDQVARNKASDASGGNAASSDSSEGTDGGDGDGDEGVITTLVALVHQLQTRISALEQQLAASTRTQVLTTRVLGQEIARVSEVLEPSYCPAACLHRTARAVEVVSESDGGSSDR